jgi:chromosome segregation ATPase
MDPMPISAYKMGRILRKDEQWVASLQEIMTPEEKAHLQELLKGTPNQYGGTMAPSATKIYEFEESIYERKIQKDKKEKLVSDCEHILNEFAKMSTEYDKLEKQIEHNTRHIEQLTSNAAQLTNQVEQLMEMVSQLIQIEYDKKMK